MIRLGAFFYLVGVLVKRFIRAYPRFCVFLFVVGLTMSILDGIPTTQAMMNDAGLSNSLAITVKPIQTNWAPDPRCNACGDENRYATMQVTNRTGKFYRNFTMRCTTPTGDFFYLNDESGIMANARDEVRSYKVDSQYSKISCKLFDAQEGKPTEYENDEGRGNWGDRVPQVMLPEDVD